MTKDGSAGRLESADVSQGSTVLEARSSTAVNPASPFAETSSLPPLQVYGRNEQVQSPNTRNHATRSQPYPPNQQWQPSGQNTPPSTTPQSDLSSQSQDVAGGAFRQGLNAIDQSLNSPIGHVPLYGPSDPGYFPLTDPQEACLFRYFVEELSHWFDLCDEKRHFQLVVPIRAKQHPSLMYSIFALSARHLTRLPKYKTPGGILYQGQLLPNLTPHDAVKYTLKCIPVFRDFHTIRDGERLESIIATAVILRQLEEIDDEDEEDDRTGTSDGVSEDTRPKHQVNFLAIIDAVLRSASSQSLFRSRTLIQAAYWMAVRQEIFHSFTRRHPPQLIIEPEYGLGASKANQIVLHTAQVAKWRWSDGSEKEWLRLQKQGEQLEEEALREFQPFFIRKADRANGEIFPTIWYSSALEVTSMQLCIIAKMVLMAENPFLGGQSTSRARWREIENQVRQMILDLCGISLCHPACPPALVHTAFGMELYGDFFTDQYERKALRGVVEKFRDARAWPDRKLSSMFQ
ncbi:hypothetical protein BGZ63DRAFT_428849 [Mariannaea sp. PMI_226]|nr:hypothetical protein BGZ63DRAFT_428849 [Mariannaea sp. PMI_226]